MNEDTSIDALIMEQIAARGRRKHRLTVVGRKLLTPAIARRDEILAHVHEHPNHGWHEMAIALKLEPSAIAAVLIYMRSAGIEMPKWSLGFWNGAPSIFHLAPTRRRPKASNEF